MQTAVDSPRVEHPFLQTFFQTLMELTGYHERIETVMRDLPTDLSAVKLYWRNQQKRWGCEIFWLVNDDYEESVVGFGAIPQHAMRDAIAKHAAKLEADRAHDTGLMAKQAAIS
jgi:hypothetical protein